MEEKNTKKNQFETKKSKNEINKMKSSNKATLVELKEAPSTSSNTKIETVESEDVTQQVTETTVQNSPNLLDNNEGRLTESAILEAVNHAEKTSRIHNTIVKMRNRRPSCIIRAYYQRPSNSNKYKRKLSDVKEVLNNYLKRFKPS
ncbi:uncharacterized protein LOC111037257 [Myzus persicae]|uniref:uncharacterized protein LOC111037257 n=1 Tax=Myzus persicae TaxID=13164 RepID=UPI000B937B4F|nr:uncharacterized protein LOC111037257 [Myzus persicae]